MKKLLLIFTLLFSVMFSSTSFAEWEEVTTSIAGDTYYLDYNKIKKQNGNIFYWILHNYLKPDKWKDMSNITLLETDCGLKIRKVYATYHNQPMGKGEPSTISPETRDWYIPSENSVDVKMKNMVCKF